MTFAQRRNRLTTHFSERISVLRRRISVDMQIHVIPRSSKGHYATVTFLTAQWHSHCVPSIIDRVLLVMETVSVHCEARTEYLGALQKLRKVTISFVMSLRLSVFVRPSAWNNSAATGRILIKTYMWIFLYGLPKNFKFHYHREKNNAYLTRRPLDIFYLIALSYS